MNVAETRTFPSMPHEAPLDMPIQSLRHAPPTGGHPPSAPRAIAGRRLLVIGSAVTLAVAGCVQMYFVLNTNGPNALGIIVLALFAPLSAWIALAFTSAVAGFFVALAGGHGELDIGTVDQLPVLGTRTALLMPTYNESPARVMAGIQAIDESLAATGQRDRFDLFILSDTTDPDIWIAEVSAFLDLRARTGGHERVFYRHRATNIGRKAGNVGDWVRRFGAAYPQMLTLDADSLMDGATIVRLVGAMERYPQVGLIQTLPVSVGGTTLFARMQQFAGRAYGPIIAHGIAWWNGAEGNYWGHNAIVRTRAFAEQAGLPQLPGRKPFGGHILSHDFVEAALMRRGGWAIHMIPGLGGSYEEGPPSLTDVAVRDRRWCQGNLQHAGLLLASGLHGISRLHLLMGIGSYLTSPLWLLFLLAGMTISLQARFVPPAYFGADKSLFPNWPEVDPVRGKWVFAATMAVLLVPKLLGFIALLADGRLRRGCGGAVRALMSVLIETVLGGLIAPIAMLGQSGAIVMILLGRDSGWNAQQRDGHVVALRQAWAGYWRHTAFGVALAAVAWSVATALFLWMLPVLLGLSLAVPLVMLTASRSAGRALRRLGLLRIPEEHAPPSVLQRAAFLHRDLRVHESEEAVSRLLRDHALLKAHRQSLPPARRRRLDPVDAPLSIGLAKLDNANTVEEALSTLTALEKAALLGTSEGIDGFVRLGMG